MSTVHNVIDARLGFPGREDTQPVSMTVSGVDAAGLLLGIRRQPRHIRLRQAGTPMPDGAYNVVQFAGGPVRYRWTQPNQDVARPWVNAMANRPLDAFAVCGTTGHDGFRVLPVEARTNSGLLVLYTRWPVIVRGTVVNTGFYYRPLRFRILDDQPGLGDLLVVEPHRGGRGYLFDGDPDTHLAFLDEPDPDMRALIQAARIGFDTFCQSFVDE